MVIDAPNDAPAREQARLAALAARQLLDTPSEPQFDAIVELAAAACNTPIALVSLVDRERQWFKAGVGVEGLRETPRSVSFCSHAIERPELMEIPDARADDRFRANPLVTGPPHVRFYAGMPLEVPGGYRLGTLCVVDVVPRRLTPDQVAALKRLAGLAVHIIETRPRSGAPAQLRGPTRDGPGESDSAASATLESLQNAVVVSDHTGRITFMNQAAEALTRWPRAEALNGAVGRVFRLEDAIAGRTADELVHYAIARAESCTLPYSVVLRRRDGSQVDIETSVTPITDADGKVRGAAVAFSELKEASREAVRLAHLAQRDALTDLPNRVLLYDRVAQAIVAARRRGGMVALLFVDLDGFKAVNDVYGHALGDRLLKAVAERLAKTVRAADTVSRFGGDEFVVLLPEVDGPDAVAAFAQKVVDSVCAPYVLQKHGVKLGASVGISIFPVDADDPDGLIEAADEAMYHAKRAGGNRHRFFTRGMTTTLARQTRVEQSVRSALDTGAYVTLYQPWVSLSDGTVAGYGLVYARQRADGGYRRAMTEIEYGRSILLAYDIGRWTLQTACTAREGLGAGAFLGAVRGRVLPKLPL